LYKKISILIITFFCLSLSASELDSLLKKAKELESLGDFKNAMLYYKKAALLNKDEKQNEPILEYGKNQVDSYEDNETNNEIKKIIFGNFDVKPYKMNYLLPVIYDAKKKIDRNQAETKFQISFKKKLAQNLFGLNEKIYLGYTQTSYWQTFEDSTPFRETNYAPEIFAQFPYINEKSPLKAYSIGLLHESNGRNKEFSRSWNRIYLNGVFQYKGFFITPRAWYRLPEREKRNALDANGDDNPDIYDYLGYGDLSISYPYKKQLFTILLRNNLKLNGNNKGAIQFDWTFPFPWVEDLYGYLQIFSGYGESLIDYDKRNDKIGLGFAITK
jgi:phospholipase A1